MKGGDFVDEMLKDGVPKEAIDKGRTFDEVMAEYQIALESAQETAKSSGRIQDSIFLRAAMAAAYRIYLLGVEDGMKGVAK